MYILSLITVLLLWSFKHWIKQYFETISGHVRELQNTTLRCLDITKYYTRKVYDIEQLLDEAMSNIKIYSVETRNIRRGRYAELLGETE